VRSPINLAALQASPTTAFCKPEANEAEFSMNKGYFFTLGIGAKMEAIVDPKFSSGHFPPPYVVNMSDCKRAKYYLWIAF